MNIVNKMYAPCEEFWSDDLSNSTLLWERKEEFVEMTLEDVNELLKSLGQKPVRIIE